MGTLKRYSWLLLAVLMLAGSCKTAEQLANEKAAKERAYLQQLQGRYGDSLILANPFYLPGGMIVKELPAPCPDFDSGTVKSKGGRLSINIPCPPVPVNADSIIRNSPAYKGALAGRRLAELQADSLRQRMAVSNADRDRYKGHRNTAWWAVGGLLLLIGAAIFGKIKGFI